MLQSFYTFAMEYTHKQLGKIYIFFIASAFVFVLHMRLSSQHWQVILIYIYHSYSLAKFKIVLKIEGNGTVNTLYDAKSSFTERCRRFTPASGKAQCSSEIYTSSTLCEFTCDPGYGLIGLETV